MNKLLQIIQNYHEAEKEVFNALKNQGVKMISLNKEISDYLHILELVPLKASEITKVTAKLRKSLKERRELKDNSKAYITTLRNKLDLLEKAHSELKKKYAELLGYYVSHNNEPLKGLT